MKIINLRSKKTFLALWIVIAITISLLTLKTIYAETVIPYSVTTGNVNDIGNDQATISNSSYKVFKVDNIDPPAITKVGINYSTDAEFKNNVKWKDCNTISDSYTVTIKGLEPNKTYYYQAYVNTNYGQYRGEVKSFKTNSVSEPSVTTGNLDLYSTIQNSVLISNNSYSNLKSFREIGVMYSKDLNFTNAKWNYLVPIDYVEPNSTFNIRLNNLEEGTKYYYFAYANTSDGKQIKGEVKTFSTPIP